MARKAKLRKVIRRKSTPEELAELQRLWKLEETPEAIAANSEAGREALQRSEVADEVCRKLNGSE